MKTFRARSIFAPNPWRHPIIAWRQRRVFKRLNEDAEYIEQDLQSMVNRQLVDHILAAEVEAFVTGRRPDEDHDAS